MDLNPEKYFDELITKEQFWKGGKLLVDKVANVLYIFLGDIFSLSCILSHSHEAHVIIDPSPTSCCLDCPFRHQGLSH